MLLMGVGKIKPKHLKQEMLKGHSLVKVATFNAKIPPKRQLIALRLALADLSEIAFLTSLLDFQKEKLYHS